MLKRPAKLVSPGGAKELLYYCHGLWNRKRRRPWLFGAVQYSMASLIGQWTQLGLPMGFLMARCAKCDQILGNIIAQTAPWLNVMDLKIFHPSAALATPPISLQDFAAELAISFW